MLGAIVALAKSSSTPISGFSSVPYEIAGFEALDYERTTGEVADGWHCTLFIRDSDPVPGGGAGFQRRVAGTFCRAPDRPLVEGELQALLTSIRYE